MQLVSHVSSTSLGREMSSAVRFEAMQRKEAEEKIRVCFIFVVDNKFVETRFTWKYNLDSKW